MNKKNNTKRALLLSVLSLLVCCSMLVGSTFAWFTDNVTSKNNIITSGNLDVVLEYKNNWNDEWKEVTADTPIFKEGALYEPGYTEVAFLRVSNAGSLALKYNLNVNVYTESSSINAEGNEFKLSDYLQVGAYTQDEYSSGANYADLLMPVMFGTREAALDQVKSTLTQLESQALVVDAPVEVGNQTSQVVALVLTMPTEVGNEANHKTGIAAPTIELGVTLTATQFTKESDSFGNDYDASAEYDEIEGLKIPRAQVDALDPTKVNNGQEVAIYDISSKTETGETTKVDVAYKFTAPHTYEEAKETQYADWYADYVISFDKEVKKDSAGLAGFYNNFGITDWIAFKAPVDVPANEELPLLESLLGQTIPYYAICRDVAVFECGAFNLDPTNVGTTMTVQLRLTNPADATDYVVAGEFKYIFQ